jgi:hypothetical protein
MIEEELFEIPEYSSGDNLKRLREDLKMCTRRYQAMLDCATRRREFQDKWVYPQCRDEGHNQRIILYRDLARYYESTCEILHTLYGQMLKNKFSQIQYENETQISYRQDIQKRFSEERKRRMDKENQRQVAMQLAKEREERSVEAELAKSIRENSTHMQSEIFFLCQKWSSSVCSPLIDSMIAQCRVHQDNNKLSFQEAVTYCHRLLLVKVNVHTTPRVCTLMSYMLLSFHNDVLWMGDIRTMATLQSTTLTCYAGLHCEESYVRYLYSILISVMDESERELIGSVLVRLFDGKLRCKKLPKLTNMISNDDQFLFEYLSSHGRLNRLAIFFDEYVRAAIAVLKKECQLYSIK